MGPLPFTRLVLLGSLAGVTAQSASVRSLLTTNQTDVITQEPTSTQYWHDTAPPTAANRTFTPFPYIFKVTPRDLEITFNIMDRTVASFNNSTDTSTLIAATAAMGDVPEANTQILSFSDVTSTGARRLDTQMIAVTEYVTASPVPTGYIYGARLAGYTGFVIQDFVVTEKAVPSASGSSSSSSSKNARLILIVVATAFWTFGTVACALHDCKIIRDFARALAHKPEEEKASEEIIPPVHGVKVSEQISPAVHQGPALAPFDASDRTTPAQAIAIPITI